ncbi:uncharacterized protein METZ01_LOCUS202041, partial [marine metagenome]
HSRGMLAPHLFLEKNKTCFSAKFLLLFRWSIPNSF